MPIFSQFSPFAAILYTIGTMLLQLPVSHHIMTELISQSINTIVLFLKAVLVNTTRDKKPQTTTNALTKFHEHDFSYIF